MRSRGGAISGRLLAGLAVFALAAGAAIWRQADYISKMRAYRPYLTANVIPGASSANTLRALTLGYDDAVSAFLWLRTIQDFGGRFRDPFALRSMSNAFWAIVSLTPQFSDVYDFGALVLGDEGGQVGLWEARVRPEGDLPGWQMLETSAEAQQAADWMLEETLRLLEFGTVNDPDHYRHPYDAAYTSIANLRDTERAIPYAEAAALRIDCPTWVEGTIAYLRGRSGEYRVALSLWFEQLREAIRNSDALGIDIRRRKIAEDGVNPWNAEILTDALRLWAEFHGGALPASLEQVAMDGFLVYYPEDVEASLALWRQAHGTTGTPPDLTTLVNEGYFPANPERPPEPLLFFDYRTYSQDFDYLLENAQEYERIPEQEFGLEKYLTVQGIPSSPLNLYYLNSNNRTMQQRVAMLQGISYMINRRDRTVQDENRLFEDTAREMVEVFNRVIDHYAENNRFPETYQELYTGVPAPVEPATGQPYIYNPQTGELRSGFFPYDDLILTPGEEGEFDQALFGQARPLDERSTAPTVASAEEFLNSSE